MTIGYDHHRGILFEHLLPGIGGEIQFDGCWFADLPSGRRKVNQNDQAASINAIEAEILREINIGIVSGRIVVSDDRVRRRLLICYGKFTAKSPGFKVEARQT